MSPKIDDLENINFFAFVLIVNLLINESWKRVIRELKNRRRRRQRERHLKMY